MDLPSHALRYFVAVAEEGHMGRAAARLHMTTPSVSEQVARLERRAGAALFVRTRTGVVLTDVGAELLPMARAAVEAQETILTWAADRVHGQTGTVRVGVFAAAGGQLRPAVLAEMAEHHPEVEVVTRRTARGEGLTALREGSLDAVYVPEPLPRDLPGVRWVTVIHQPRVLVVPAGHPLAGRDEVDIGETDGEVFIPMAGGDEASVAWWLVDPRPSGVRPERAAPAADFDEMLDRCAAGRGLGMATVVAADHYQRPGLTFVRLRDVPAAQTALCWRADERSVAVRAFVGTVRRVAREPAQR
ncbi:LysR family transcriptional regulator [Klenkia sp. PcliD-1-E]|uniref:LysR family transcriptional regulator n=1 Tax=Klenkia sp. PcliD-1-E TaxID=2954492 RepID=UPI002096A8E6|nr:LysR family transcriptional regulator [Klenkia sp. PcliD-1-E]MCO7220912.1 LysR family transcriptional regulator [Klenkia sp. PcliD-1-E]